MLQVCPGFPLPITIIPSECLVYESCSPLLMCHLLCLALRCCSGADTIRMKFSSMSCSKTSLVVGDAFQAAMFPRDICGNPSLTELRDAEVCT